MTLENDDFPAGSLLDMQDGPDAAREKPAKLAQAVALTYDREEDPAPRIVASGKGEMAEKILALAFANGVRVREDKELVEILGAMEVDSVIPLEAFAAVAEILNYVYKMNAIYGDPRQNGKE